MRQSKSRKTLIESDHYPDVRWGVKLINGNVGFDGKIRAIPLWSAFLLLRLKKD